MKNKKAQDVSITTIIIAAIALVVLVVIILVFTGKIRIFGMGYEDSTSEFTSGKECVVSGAESARGCEPDVDACARKKGRFLTEPEGGWTDCRDSCCQY